MRLSFQGLQGKIIIIIAITVICVVGVSTSIAMYLTRQLVEEEIYRKTLAQARMTAHELVLEETIRNPENILRLLRKMQLDSTSVKQSDFFLHFPDHHLLATTAPEGEHLELDNVPGIERYFEFERPEEDAITVETPQGKFWIMGITIREQNRAVGCLTLKVSKSQTSVVTLALVIRNLLLMLASLAVVVLVIHVFFLHHVRGPVREMVRVMEAAEGGQLHIRAAARSEDEIGELAKHLNRMLERIENFNNELGQKVRDATGELARRNEELKRINEELFETQRSLARSERLAVAGQLAASLAHEIGTPLNSISGHVQLLARRKTGDEASARRLEIIEKQIENIVRTVKQLLSWTHKLDLRIEPVDLSHLLEETILLSSPALRLRKIRLQKELNENCPPVQADPGYLQQVFLNLINNSMDAMPEGGDLNLRLRFPANGEARQVAIEFSDTGHGMAPETLAHIFDPMFTTKRMGTGAGLGLAISDQIVRQHSGAIQVESELHRGTRFTVLLPVEGPEKVEPAAETAETAAANSDPTQP